METTAQITVNRMEGAKNGVLDSMLESYRKEFEPADCHETFLVEQMAMARLRLEQIQRLQMRFFSQPDPGAGEPGDADEAILAGLRKRGADVLNSLHRYAAAAERSYFKAHRELLDHRSRRAKARMAQAPAAAETDVMNSMLSAIVNAPIPPEMIRYPSAEFIRERARSRRGRPAPVSHAGHDWTQAGSRAVPEAIPKRTQSID